MPANSIDQSQRTLTTSVFTADRHSRSAPNTAASVWEIIARYFPGQTITDRSRLLVEDLLHQQQ